MSESLSSSESRRPVLSPCKRVFLGALVALGVSYLPVRVHASPMVDGPAVCFINDSPVPNVENPDPLNECPENGNFRRLDPGVQTQEYLDKYYPDGPETPILQELS